MGSVWLQLGTFEALSAMQQACAQNTGRFKVFFGGNSSLAPYPATEDIHAWSVPRAW